MMLTALALGQEPVAPPAPPTWPVIERRGLGFRIDGERAGWWKVRRTLKHHDLALEQLRKADESLFIGLGLSAGSLVAHGVWLSTSARASSRCNAGGEPQELSGLGLWLANLLGSSNRSDTAARGACALAPAFFVAGTGLSLASLAMSFKQNHHQLKAVRVYQQDVGLTWTDRPGVQWTVRW